MTAADMDTVIINGKKYWAHVVETAKFYRQLKKEAKSRGEEKRIDDRIKKFCRLYKSLEEVLSCGAILDKVPPQRIPSTAHAGRREKSGD